MSIISSRGVFIMNDNILECSKTRSKFCLNNFYSIDRLQDLADRLSNNPGLKNAISSYKIDEQNLSIFFQFRQTYTGNYTNSLEWYTDSNVRGVLYQFFQDYKMDIVSIIGIENLAYFFKNLHLHYFFSMYGPNTVVINFM